jgi:hypothetical protein
MQRQLSPAADKHLRPLWAAVCRGRDVQFFGADMAAHGYMADRDVWPM